MFNSIKGILTGRSYECIYIETGGIEWELLVPALSSDLFGTVGSETKAYTWLYHREDQMRLFGFVSAEERSLFLDLIKVDGIGPKQAVKIMSGLDFFALQSALEEGNVDKLQKAPGIGKKTAQKMVLALKGKLTNLNAPLEETGRKSFEFEDIAAALADMGFDRKAAVACLEELASEMKRNGLIPQEHEQELFRRAIVGLS